MNTHLAYLREFRWLPGRKQSPLCSECVAELGQSATQAPLPNLRYIGPVLVRSELDYHVISLPDRVGIIAGRLTDQDRQAFATRIRAEKSADRGLRVDYLIKDDLLKEPAKLNEMVNRLKADPFHPVRDAAPKACLQISARRYDALGQYSNAVDTLHQAIHLDSKDGGSYNHLAWIKATCSDAAVRNGNEAVSAASKPCELTEWKNCRFIDALAAACAEAGDFKRAIQFQEVGGGAADIITG